MALWAIDLSDAYRKLGVQCSELWQQCLIWADGVQVDYRAVFGLAHLVGLFQRISSFVPAVAASRIEQYDAHTPTRLRSRNGRPTGRSAQHVQDAKAYIAMIYLDDASGATPIAPGENILPELLPVT